MNTASENFKHSVAAAAGIFDEYGDFIRDTIRMYVQDEDQAEDLVQAFFVSLVRSPVPEGIQKVKSYLFKAMINDIVDTERRRKKYGCVMRIYAELYIYPEEQKTPPELLVQLEQIRKAIELIQRRLPPREAKAVALRYREQHSVEEAAEKMGVDSMTLRGYVCQGLARIRRLLRNVGLDVTD